MSSLVAFIFTLSFSSSLLLLLLFIAAPLLISAYPALDCPPGYYFNGFAGYCTDATAASVNYPSCQIQTTVISTNGGICGESAGQSVMISGTLCSDDVNILWNLITNGVTPCGRPQLGDWDPSTQIFGYCAAAPLQFPSLPVIADNSDELVNCPLNVPEVNLTGGCIPDDYDFLVVQTQIAEDDVVLCVTTPGNNVEMNVKLDILDSVFRVYLGDGANLQLGATFSGDGHIIFMCDNNQSLLQLGGGGMTLFFGYMHFVNGQVLLNKPRIVEDMSGTFIIGTGSVTSGSDHQLADGVEGFIYMGYYNLDIYAEKLSQLDVGCTSDVGTCQMTAMKDQDLIGLNSTTATCNNANLNSQLSDCCTACNSDPTCLYWKTDTSAPVCSCTLYRGPLVSTSNQKDIYSGFMRNSGNEGAQLTMQGGVLVVNILCQDDQTVPQGLYPMTPSGLLLVFQGCTALATLVDATASQPFCYFVEPGGGLRAVSGQDSSVHIALSGTLQFSAGSDILYYSGMLVGTGNILITAAFFFVGNLPNIFEGSTSVSQAGVTLSRTFNQTKSHATIPGFLHLQGGGTVVTTEPHQFHYTTDIVLEASSQIQFGANESFQSLTALDVDTAEIEFANDVVVRVARWVWLPGTPSETDLEDDVYEVAILGSNFAIFGNGTIIVKGDKFDGQNTAPTLVEQNIGLRICWSPTSGIYNGPSAIEDIASVDLRNGSTYNVNANGTLTLSGEIFGSGDVIYSGPLVLQPAFFSSSYTGFTTFQAAQVQIMNTSAGIVIPGDFTLLSQSTVSIAKSYGIAPQARGTVTPGSTMIFSANQQFGALIGTSPFNLTIEANVVVAVNSLLFDGITRVGVFTRHELPTIIYGEGIIASCVEISTCLLQCPPGFYFNANFGKCTNNTIASTKYTDCSIQFQEPSPGGVCGESPGTTLTMQAALCSDMVGLRYDVIKTPTNPSCQVRPDLENIPRTYLASCETNPILLSNVPEHVSDPRLNLTANPINHCPGHATPVLVQGGCIPLNIDYPYQYASLGGSTASILCVTVPDLELNDVTMAISSSLMIQVTAPGNGLRLSGWLHGLGGDVIVQHRSDVTTPVVFAGAVQSNTYGNTYVVSGTLALEKARTFNAISGNTYISQSTLLQGNDHQVPDATTMWVLEGGVYDLNVHAERFYAVNFGCVTGCNGDVMRGQELNASDYFLASCDQLPGFYTNDMIDAYCCDVAVNNYSNVLFWKRVQGAASCVCELGYGTLLSTQSNPKVNSKMIRGHGDFAIDGGVLVVNHYCDDIIGTYVYPTTIEYDSGLLFFLGDPNPPTPLGKDYQGPGVWVQATEDGDGGFPPGVEYVVDLNGKAVFFYHDNPSYQGLIFGKGSVWIFANVFWQGQFPMVYEGSTYVRSPGILHLQRNFYNTKSLASIPHFLYIADGAIVSMESSNQLHFTSDVLLEGGAIIQLHGLDHICNSISIQQSTRANIDLGSGGTLRIVRLNVDGVNVSSGVYTFPGQSTIPANLVIGSGTITIQGDVIDGANSYPVTLLPFANVGYRICWTVRSGAYIKHWEDPEDSTDVEVKPGAIYTVTSNDTSQKYTMTGRIYGSGDVIYSTPVRLQPLAGNNQYGSTTFNADADILSGSFGLVIPNNFTVDGASTLTFYSQFATPNSSIGTIRDGCTLVFQANQFFGGLQGDSFTLNIGAGITVISALTIQGYSYNGVFSRFNFPALIVGDGILSTCATPATCPNTTCAPNSQVLSFADPGNCTSPTESYVQNNYCVQVCQVGTVAANGSAVRLCTGTGNGVYAPPTLNCQIPPPPPMFCNQPQCIPLFRVQCIDLPDKGQCGNCIFPNTLGPPGPNLTKCGPMPQGTPLTLQSVTAILDLTVEDPTLNCSSFQNKSTISQAKAGIANLVGVTQTRVLIDNITCVFNGTSNTTNTTNTTQEEVPPSRRRLLSISSSTPAIYLSGFFGQKEREEGGSIFKKPMLLLGKSGNSNSGSGSPTLVIVFTILPSASAADESPIQAIRSLIQQLASNSSTIRTNGVGGDTSAPDQDLTDTEFVINRELCLDGSWQIVCPTSIGFSSQTLFTTTTSPNTGFGLSIQLSIQVSYNALTTSTSLKNKLKSKFKNIPPVPAGLVQFFDDTGGVLGDPANLVEGNYTLTYTPTSAAQHHYTAYFFGDPSYKSSYTPTKFGVNITKGASTTKFLTGTNKKVKIKKGTITTLVVRVQPVRKSSPTIPQGQVQWIANQTHQIGGGIHAALNASGWAVWHGALPLGIWNISAKYMGDSNFLPSSANTWYFVQVVTLLNLKTETPAPTTKKPKVP